MGISKRMGQGSVKINLPPERDRWRYGHRRPHKKTKILSHGEGRYSWRDRQGRWLRNVSFHTIENLLMIDLETEQDLERILELEEKLKRLRTGGAIRKGGLL